MTTADLFTRDFRLWLGAKTLSNVARKMLEVALSWQIYELTRSPLALGLIGLTEAVPFLGVSLWAGHLVDRHEKKPFMMLAGATLLACALALLGITFFSRTPLPLLYAVIFLAGAGLSFGSVASSVYVQMMVPAERFSRAAAWGLAAFTGSTIVGPILAGALLSVSSLRVVYAASAGLFVTSLFLTAALRFRPARSPSPQEPALRRIREGVRFVLTRRVLLACMALDMVAVLFGDAVAIFPVFAELLNAGPLGFGILRAAPAAGAAAVSFLEAARPFIRPAWGGLKKATFFFGVFMIAFAFSKTLWLSAVFLILAGMADGVSVIIRQSLYQSRTPDALRGRVAALSGIFISASNELGAFESGVAARYMGAVPSVVFGGTLTLVSVFAMGRLFRDVKDD